MILAGDIGGTNTRLGFFSLDRGVLGLEAEATYPSQEYKSLDEIVLAFVAGHSQSVAAAFWDAELGRHRPFACEGGHADFAARNELELELLRHLLKRYARVSCERILSGSGLFAIYGFLCHSRRGDEDPVLTEALLRQQLPAPIVKAALDGRSPRCSLALDMFVSLYGAEAGNLALKLMARGGVYIGGGIAPKILARLQQPAFMDAFLAKGRMRPLLERMPVKVILDDRAGLRGAARHAASRLR